MLLSRADTHHCAGLAKQQSWICQELIVDLRDLKTFLHLAESRHFGRSARAMHVSPSTLSRQIQRLESDLGQPLFVRDNRTVTLTDTGEHLRQFAQQTLLHYQQMRHQMGQQGPSLNGELRLFCSVTAAYSHLPPILDRFRAEQPCVEINLTTGDAADAVEKVDSGDADLAIAGKPETLPPGMAFTLLENLTLLLIAPSLPCPVHHQAQQTPADWSQVPFILPDAGPVRRRIELWFRQHKLNNPQIYATVAGHEAMVSMVALGCGVALIPDVVLENSPEPVRNRVMILAHSDEKMPFELGVCVQKKQLHEPIINAFWQIVRQAV